MNQTFWQKNGIELSQKNPSLWTKLQQVQVDSLELSFVQNQYWVLKTLTSQGKKISFNSQYSLEQDMERAVNKINHQASLVLWIGLGMGYEVEHFYKRKGNATKIIIIEPRLDILKMALTYKDMSEFITSDDVYLLSGSTHELEQQMNLLFDESILVVAGSIDEYIHPAYRRLYHSPFLDEMFDLVARSIHHLFYVFGNSSEDTLLGINHFFSNIHYGVETLRIADLGDVYKGYPAICVAAGPSLDQNIHVLKEIQDYALIFCVDAIWHRLIEEGIVPDAIVTLERDKGTHRLFFANKIKRLEGYPTCLIAHAMAYPETLRQFMGQPIMCVKEGLPFEQEVSKLLPQINHLPMGMSCAHSSFVIARVLGCDPIIVVGQDLAYGRNGFSHAGGTYGEKKTKTDAIFKGMRHFSVPNIHRTGMVETNTLYDSFRRWFEDEIGRDPNRKYVNATEGGAYISGMDVMSLQEVADVYMTLRSPKIRLMEAIKRYGNTTGAVDCYKQLEEYFSLELAVLEDIRIMIRKLNKLLATVSQIFERNDETWIDQIVTEMHHVFKQINDIWLASELFFFIIQFYAIRLKRYMNTKQKVTYDQLRDMYNFVQLTIDEVNGVLEQTINEFRRGLVIIQNHGGCENIDTPLMGEMYE